jgi:hypothetical protein
MRHILKSVIKRDSIYRSGNENACALKILDYVIFIFLLFYDLYKYKKQSIPYSV